MSPKDPSPGKPILTEALAGFFEFLERYTFFSWVRKTFHWEGSPRFVEGWVVSWLAFSIVSFPLSFLQWPSVVCWLVGSASAYRVYEIVVYAANTVLFRSVRGPTRPLRSRERYAVLILINYAEIILWFATYYSLLRPHIFAAGMFPQELMHDAWFAAFVILRESVVMMVANTTGAFAPHSTGALVLVTVQMVIGIFMTLVVVARLINLLPIPGAKADGTGR